MKFLKRTEVKLFFTIFLVYLFFLSDYGGNWMADSIIDSAMAFVDTGSFITDDYIKAPQDNAFFKGHYYSGFAPGASFLVMPLYFIVKPFLNLLPETILGYPQLQMKVIIMNILATILLTIPASALLSVLIYRFLDNFTKDKKYKIFITFFFAFGTILFTYSIGFYRRPIAIFLTFLAFYLLYNIKYKKIKESYKLVFLIGLILGFSIFIEYTMFITVGILSLYFITFMKNKKLILFMLGLIIPIIALMGYHYYVFDNPFTTPYMHRVVEKSQTLISFSDVFRSLVPSLESTYGITLSFHRGLFVYMPILFLSLLGIILFFKNKSQHHFIEISIILLIFLVYLWFNAQYKVWAAGCSFGPRFLIPMLPFLMIPLVYSFKKINKKIIISMGIVSMFINLLPAIYGITGLWRGICGSSNPLKEYLLLIPERGLTNYTLSLIKERLYDLSILDINIITIILLLILTLIIVKIWKHKE